MEMMDSRRSLSRRQEKRLLQAAADVTRTEYDAPERTGCPTAESLELLARRRSPLVDSPQIVEHIGTCSPCFVAYSRYRAAHKRRVRIGYALTSAAAGVVLAIVITHLLHTSRPGPLPVPKERARSSEPLKEVAELVVDLRKMGVTRSADPGGSSKEALARLPRANLALSVYLPTGSEDGIYEMALTSGSPEPIVGATGEAKLENHIEVLSLRLDLTNVPPGRYDLRLRRALAQWRTYSVLLE
jgi:hypothetical protein